MNIMIGILLSYINLLHAVYGAAHAYEHLYGQDIDRTTIYWDSGVTAMEALVHCDANYNGGLGQGNAIPVVPDWGKFCDNRVWVPTDKGDGNAPVEWTERGPPDTEYCMSSVEGSGADPNTECTNLYRCSICKGSRQTPMPDIAYIYAQCDNTAQVQKWNPNIRRWLAVTAIEDNFNNLIVYRMGNVAQQNAIRIKCKNDGGPGGFIATLWYNGIALYTSKQTTNVPVGKGWYTQSSGQLEYTAANGGPTAWQNAIHYGPITDQAYWVWNGEEYGYMNFVFQINTLAGNTAVSPFDLVNDNNGNLMDHGFFEDPVVKELLFGAFLVFIFINNIFICYWCVCRDGNGNDKNDKNGQYDVVKIIDE